MAYKWIETGKLVRRLADGACIPADAANRDWREVLGWIAAGNAIEAADPPPIPLDLSDIDNLDKALKAIGLLMRQYCNGLLAGTYTNKTAAQLRSDFTTIYRGLP